MVVPTCRVSALEVLKTEVRGPCCARHGDFVRAVARKMDKLSYTRANAEVTLNSRRLELHTAERNQRTPTPIALACHSESR